MSRTATIFLKKMSMGILLSCVSLRPGLSTTSPPDHRSPIRASPTPSSSCRTCRSTLLNSFWSMSMSISWGRGGGGSGSGTGAFLRPYRGALTFLASVSVGASLCVYEPQVPLSSSGAGQHPSRQDPTPLPCSSVRSLMKNAQAPQRPDKSRSTVLHPITDEHPFVRRSTSKPTPLPPNRIGEKQYLGWCIRIVS